MADTSVNSSEGRKMPEGELDYDLVEDDEARQEFESRLLSAIQDLVTEYKDRMHLGSMATHFSLVVETLDQAGQPCIRLFTAPDDRLSITLGHSTYMDTIAKAQLLRMRNYLPQFPTNTQNGETE